MSNIFGALRNGGVGTPDLEEDLPQGSVEAPRTLLSRQTPSTPKMAGVTTMELPTEITCRSVRLRLSALAPVLPFDPQNQRAAEQYKIIRTKILHHARKPQFVLVSSASSGDGKTVTSINMAGSLALKPETRVLLIDGDLRQPSVARTLGISCEPGLSDVLAGKVSFENAVVRAAEVPNLYVLPAGKLSTRAADLLDSERWRMLAASVRERFTHVICDAPPIAIVADYELLQLAADGVVVVARPGHTERYACQKARTAVDAKKMLGVVLNCVDDWWLWKTPSYGYYAKRTPESKR